MNDDYLTMFAACVIRDAIVSATAACWERRATEFEAALPRPGDFHGASTPATRAAIALRIKAKADACRTAAAFWRYVHSGQLPEHQSSGLAA